MDRNSQIWPRRMLVCSYSRMHSSGGLLTETGCWFCTLCKCIIDFSWSEESMNLIQSIAVHSVFVLLTVESWGGRSWSGKAHALWTLVRPTYENLIDLLRFSSSVTVPCLRLHSVIALYSYVLRYRSYHSSRTMGWLCIIRSVSSGVGSRSMYLVTI